MIKTVFYGTGEFAATILRSISENKDFEILAVITAPDKPVGRKREVQKSAVKILAENLNFPILQPSSLKEFDDPILSQADLGVVAEYGFLIPKRILDLPKHKTLNLHGSLLPKYRGASPIQTALLNGDKETGVTMILMDKKMDHGPIVAMEKISIKPEETRQELFAGLAKLAADLLVKQAPRYVAGLLKPIEQDHKNATFCKILSREDGEIDFKKTSQEIYNQYRALTPWPGVWMSFKGKRLKLLSITPTTPKNLSQGQILAEKGQLYLGCGQNSCLEVLTVQLEGKKPVSAKDFANGMKNI